MESTDESFSNTNLSCSRTREEDRESSSSTSSSSRFATKQFQSWHEQCRVVRAMRNKSESAMLRMPSLLESRNCLLHLWTSLGWKRIQPTFSPMATECFLNSELRHQEGATSWCSAWQNWGTERAFHSPQCAEKMSQREIWRNSRSLPKRFNISWFTAQKLAGLKRRALRWTNYYRKTTPLVHCLKGSKDTG